ncbi:MAG: hypothetical protein JW742_07055 [Candidatus Aminicenantes bacterium]|nr:hypothetical protein [Candidatus Aminicenantes bacterium]
MKAKMLTVLCLLAVWSAVGPASIFAQEDGYPFSFSNFGLEIYGGLARVKLEQFNSLARYEDAYQKFFYLDRYDFLYGADATATRTGDRPVRPLEQVWPFGVRLKYRASPTLTIAVGLQRVNGSRRSTAGLVVTAPDGSGSEYSLPAFRLAASAWIPELQVQLGWNLPSAFRFEAFIGGGPMFAECRTTIERHDADIDALGRRSETVTTLDMSGRNTGICGELGLRLRFSPLKRLGLFAEGGFAFRQASRPKGFGTLRTETRAPGSEPAVRSESWDDKSWGLIRYAYYRYWGRLSGVRAGIDYQVTPWSSPGSFYLDLSGFQLKAGVSFGL